MKTKYPRAGVLSLVIGGIGVLASGCVAYPNGTVGIQPVVVAPAPGVTPVFEVEPVLVPDSYVWDGYEYVGVVGAQYFYLGPGDVWLVCDPIRFARFHDWEGHHPDWRNHATRNDHFRRDAYGPAQPVRHGNEEKR